MKMMRSEELAQLAHTPPTPTGKQLLEIHEEQNVESPPAWVYHTLETIPEESQGIVMEDEDVVEKHEENVQVNEDSNMTIYKRWKEKVRKRVKGDFRRKRSFNTNNSLDFKNEFESEVEIYTPERKFQCMEMRKREEFVELASTSATPAGKQLLEIYEEANIESTPAWTYHTLETITEESNSIVENEDGRVQGEEDSSMTINKRRKEKVLKGVKVDFKRKNFFNAKNYLDFKNEFELKAEICTPERKAQKSNNFKNEQLQPTDSEDTIGLTVEGKSKEVELDDRSSIDDAQSVDQTYSSVNTAFSFFCLSPLANASFDRSKTPGIKSKRQQCKKRQRPKRKCRIDDEKEWTTRMCTVIEEAEDYELQIE